MKAMVDASYTLYGKVSYAVRLELNNSEHLEYRPDMFGEPWIVTIVASYTRADGTGKEYVFKVEGPSGSTLDLEKFNREKEMKRKHYDIILAWANGAEIQWRINSNCEWEDVDSPSFYDQYQYRIKPKTIMIGDVEVPMPLQEAPIYGQEYWTILLDPPDLVVCHAWFDDNDDRRLLERGLIHLDKESAVLHANALIKVSGGQV